tara:strand:+ start:1650 stop:3614 length:1965 start_codon:yes stop_codon:yes gene_type:complete
VIPKHKIDEILAATNIEEVVGEYVNLKRSGRQLRALSPFANEKTPSFYVVPEKQIFKDFSTGKGGNAVSFLMEHEHFTYPEALRFLAKKYNIELEEEEYTTEQKEAENERESLYIVTQYAQEYFDRQLQETDEGKSVGLGYFKQRGFTPETIETFSLGYSPNSWDAFTNAAKDKGYKKEFLEKTGLVKKSSKRENHYYDGFKGRVMFPIHNLSGRPIGFGARTLVTDKKAPKYLNSPESLIYNKSGILYGIFQAKSEIIKNDNCFLVEGYTDVISFHQSGIKNVVASSGTSLTSGQIKLIKRYSHNITVLYDGDEAGIKASFRGVNMILEEGMNVKLVIFPDGEDPDSFARSHDPEELAEYVKENAKDFIVTKTEILLKGTGNDPILKAGLIKDIVESIAKIPDAIARSVYVKECSTLLDIEEETLFNELGKIRNAEISKSARKLDHNQYEAPLGVVPKNKPLEAFESNIEAQEKDLLRILINYGDQNITVEQESEKEEKEEEVEVGVAPYVLHELANDDLKMSNPEHTEILNALIEMVEKDAWNVQSILHHENPKISNLAAGLITSKYELAKWELRQIRVADETKKLKRAVDSALYSFKSKLVAVLISNNRLEIKTAQENDDYEQTLVLLKQQTRYDEIKASLSKPIGRVILS